jgi:hypothetical protein
VDHLPSTLRKLLWRPALNTWDQTYARKTFFLLFFKGPSCIAPSPVCGAVAEGRSDLIFK